MCTATAALRPHHIAWDSERSRISAEARFVASGTPWMSHTFSSAWMSGSCGCEVERIAQEHDRVDVAGDDARADLEVAALGPAVHALDLEVEQIGDLSSGMTGGDQP